MCVQNGAELSAGGPAAGPVMGRGRVRLVQGVGGKTRQNLRGSVMPTRAEEPSAREHHSGTVRLRDKTTDNGRGGSQSTWS